MRVLSTRLRDALVALRSEVGAVATEYGLLLTLIAIVIVVGLTAFGGSLLGLWDTGVDGFPP